MTIKTKYGSAGIHRGYYIIWSDEYGFRGKPLHRIVAADMIGCGIPPQYDVHHRNFNKLDNRPENLLVLPHVEHMKIHNPKGVPTGVKQSDETIEKRRKALTKDYGRIRTAGYSRGKRMYELRYKDLRKRSIYKQKLIDWFKGNYPDVELEDRT